MRNIIFIFFFSIGVFSCHTSKTSSAKIIIKKENTTALNGTWQLQMLFASENKWSSPPFININFKEKTFTGSSSCNTISGRFTITNDYIAFDKNITSTKMLCAGNNEKTFLAALQKINKYIITNDELELSQGEIVLMRFKRS